MIRYSLNSKLKSVDALCPICAKAEELISHALFEYDHVRAVWCESHFSLLTHNLHPMHVLNWWLCYCEHDQPISILNDDHAKRWILATYLSLRKAMSE